MENGEGNSHGEDRHAPRREPKTDVIPFVDPDLAERMRRTRIMQLAVGVPTAIMIALGGAYVLDSVLKASAPTYGEVLPAPSRLTDQEKKENGAYLQDVADKVVHTLEPAPDAPEDDGEFSYRQRVQEHMKRTKFVNDAGGDSEAGIVKAKDPKTGDVTTYYFVVNHVPDSDRVASVEYGAEVSVQGSDSDVPDEDSIVRRTATTIGIGADGTYTLQQKTGVDAIAGPKGHEYGVLKIGNVTATTADVDPRDLLLRRQIRHRDVFAANANFDQVQLGAANREPFEFRPDRDGVVTTVLESTPDGEPVRIPR